MPQQQAQRRLPTQPTESFTDLLHALENHTWSHLTNNYGDYIKAVKEENLLFGRAMAFAVRGLDAFRDAKERSITELIDMNVDQAKARVRTDERMYAQRDKDNLMKYVTPVQQFRMRLDTHDWHYDYTDDGSVWRAGLDRHKKLLQEAKDNGPEFQAMWLEVYKKAMQDLANDRPFDVFYRIFFPLGH